MYIALASLNRGRLLGALGWRSEVRRPRAWFAATHSGGSGALPAVLGLAARSSLTVGVQAVDPEASSGAHDAPGAEGEANAPRSAARSRDKNAAVERRQ